LSEQLDAAKLAPLDEDEDESDVCIDSGDPLDCAAASSAISAT
jgi:hypothetical protein